MRSRASVALPLLWICCFASLAASAQEREVPLDAVERPASFEIAGVRISGFFVGSANYNSHIQLVPEFAGAAPVSSEPNNTTRFADVAPLGVDVLRGPTLDGLGTFYRESITESTEEPVDVAAVYRKGMGSAGNVDAGSCILRIPGNVRNTRGSKTYATELRSRGTSLASERGNT